MILFIGEHPAYAAIYGLLLRMGATVATVPQPGVKYHAILIGAAGTSLSFPGDILTAIEGQTCPILVLSVGDMFVSQAANRSNLKKESMSENWLPTLTDDGVVPLWVEKCLSISHKARLTVFRIFDVYGPSVRGLVDQWNTQIRTDQEVLVPGPVQQSRCWLYVEDLEPLLISWLKNPIPGVFHIGSQFEATFLSLIEKLSDIHQKTPLVRQLPIETYTWWRTPDIRKVAATYQWEATTYTTTGLLKYATMPT